ncbi:MAG TPA: hypothetical protein VMF13_01355 [Luteitalea sp.]|nr:hypothetical protein [Luteitalea sp.]
MPVRSARGVALPGVLLLSAFLIGVTGWLVGHVRTDQMVARFSDADDEAERVAQAAVESVALALGSTMDWRPAGLAAVSLACPAATRLPVTMDVGEERARVQSVVDAGSRWGSDRPRFEVAWQCHAEGVLTRWPAGAVNPAVVVLIADEPEGDGLPGISQNERLLVRAVSRGAADSRGEASATITRTAPGAPVVLEAFRRGPAQ